MHTQNNPVKLAAIIVGAMLISACATTTKSVGEGQLLSPAAQAQATATGVPIGQTELGTPTEPSVEYLRVKTDRSIFLDPPEVDNPAVYVRVRDSSGRDWGGFLQRAVVARIKAAGYSTTRNAAKAAYVLNANVLVAQEVSAFELAKLDETEYGQNTSGIIKSIAAGAVVGGVAGGVLGDSKSAAAGAIAGGLVGGILGSIDQNERRKRIAAKQQTKYYSVIVDVELRERIGSGGEVQREGTQNLSFSSSQTDGLDGSTIGNTGEEIEGEVIETFSETSKWKRHRTRVLGKAKGKLIAFEDVESDFAEKLSRSIAGAF